MTVYYHGTDERSAKAIESEGFLGSDPSKFTDGFSHVDKGVIFLATTIEHAQGYGDVVFAIDTDAAELFGECPVTGLPEFAVSVDADYFFERIN
jgi:hypothetical protein